MGSSTSSNLQDKHVVIVGGGYAGVAAANHLRGKCKLTLIDPKDCMHHCVGSLRAVVEPGYAKKIFIPYKPAFGESFKRGKVTNIDVERKKVTIDTEEILSYDYLIIATGSTGAFPGKMDMSIADVSRAVDMYNDMLQKAESTLRAPSGTLYYEELGRARKMKVAMNIAEIKAASTIVLIGGGPVGVELAGEIKTDLKDKEVTLIHNKPALIGGPFNDTFSTSIKNQLVNLGVNVLLDQRVSNLEDLVRKGFEKCMVKTSKKVTLKADLVVMCVGMKTNDDAYENTLAKQMDDKGCLKVNQSFQVAGFQDVFAIGDCCSADSEAKMAFKAAMHAQVVANNIRDLADGKAPSSTYKPPGPLMLVPIGRNGGVMQFGSLVLGSLVTRLLKSKDLFTRRFWGEMRQSVPLT